MAENLIPIAVSSELDVTGEERIHVANRALLVRPEYVVSVLYDYVMLETYIAGTQFPSGDWRFITPYRMTEEGPVQLEVDIQPASVGRGGSFSPNAEWYVHPMDAAPEHAVYQKTDDTYNLVTISKTTDADNGFSSVFSPDGSTMFIGYRGGGTYAHVIAYELVEGVWTEVAALLSADITTAVSLPSQPTNIAVSADNTMVAVAFGSSGLRVFSYNGSTFTDISSSVSPSLTAETTRYVSFHGDYLAIRTGGFPNANSFAMYLKSGTTLTLVDTEASDFDVNVGSWTRDGARFIGAYSSDGTYRNVGIYTVASGVMTLENTIQIPRNMTTFEYPTVEGITVTEDLIYISTSETSTSPDIFKVLAFDILTGDAMPAFDLVIPTSPTVGMLYATNERGLASGRG